MFRFLVAALSLASAAAFAPPATLAGSSVARAPAMRAVTAMMADEVEDKVCTSCHARSPWRKQRRIDLGPSGAARLCPRI